MIERDREPGCGHFATNGEERNPGAPGKGPPNDLSLEVDALRSILGRLLDEVGDAERLAMHVPRLTNASTQVSRTRHQTGGPAHHELLELLTPTLEELDRLQATIPDV
jgi:hypothetical protein